MTVAEVLQRLPDAVQGSDQWKARCPSHDDNKASLSVREGNNGKAILFCHAGCEFEAIRAAIGDERPFASHRETRPEDGAKGRIVKAYPYTDKSGVLLYEVCRMEPKDFRQRRPDGKGGFIWNLKGVSRVLYRLLEVKAAIAEGRTIFLPEGEKDCDNLAKIGLTATTNAGGAGKWEAGYTETLRGGHVVILPDNDEPGRKHAATVAAALSGKAASVRVLALPNLPDKGDVTDWLKERHKEGKKINEMAAELEALANAAPEQGTETVQEAAADVPPPADTRVPSPPTLPHEALYGLAGDIVCALDPHTESDPAAVLLQFLTAFGNIINNGPFFRVEGDQHRANLFMVLVGPSAKGRKGTSWGNVRRLFDFAPEWTKDRLQSGLSSGEGLIQAVRDEELETDRRLLTEEPEFASVLRVMERDGNTISARLRDAWDGRTLRTMTKMTPLTATGAHISLIGHITKDELLRYLQRTETANGFANRVLWVFAKRSKLLPEGGDFFNDPRRAVLITRLRDAFNFAYTVQEVKRDEEARAIWRAVYPTLSADVYGLFGAVTSRAEAQVLRLSLLYALLDSSDIIRGEHLIAALAVWQYCADSARFIFGDATGDATADAILAGLRGAGTDGLTRTEISELLKRNASATQINHALELLIGANFTRQTEGIGAGGRTVQRWYAK